MSRIRVNIDRLVLNGFGQLESKALVDALQSQLSQALADPGPRSDWARSHRTPVLNLGRMTLTTGSAGSATLGRQLAGAIKKGLRP